MPTINDLTNPEGIRHMVVQVLQAIPFLSELAYYMTSEEAGEVLNRIWDVEEELRHEATHYPGSELRYSARDLLEDIQNIVSAAIAYNNDPWNFAPGGAPPKASYDVANLAIVALLDGLHPKPGMTEQELFVGPGDKPKSVLQVRQLSTRRWELREWISDENGSLYAVVKLVSKHTTQKAVLKAKDLLLNPPCPHAKTELYNETNWCVDCGEDLTPKPPKKRRKSQESK